MSVQIHVVRKGDTLWSLARHFYGQGHFWPGIFVANAIRHQSWPATLTDPNRLYPGQRLIIPRRGALARLRRHPAQRTFPHVAAPAAAHPHSPLALRQAVVPAPLTGPPKPALDLTHVNSIPFKYELDLLPPIKAENAEFTWESSYKGQIYIWVDKQITTANITQKGVEMIAKQETDTVLGKLVNSGKITVDWVNKKVGYENLITMNARGAPPSQVQTGVYIDTTNPNPALRVKFTWPQLMGPLAPHYLFISTNLQVVVDIRKKLNPPEGPQAQRAPAPNLAMGADPVAAPNLAMGASPTMGPAPLVASAAESDRPWWDRKSILYTGAAIIVAASIATDIITLGLDAEKDPFAGAAALRLATMAARR